MQNSNECESNRNRLFSNRQLLANDPVAREILAAEEDHKILGVPPNATEEMIIAAYKERILKYHPDKYPENTEDNQLANSITKKLNLARERMLAQLSEEKEKTDLTHAQRNDQKSFQVHIKNIMVSEIFSLSTKNFDLWHSEGSYCLGMVLAWVSHVLNSDQSSFFQKLKPAFAKNTTKQNVIHFAEEISRFIPKDLTKSIQERDFDSFLTKANSYEECINSGINLTWNFQAEGLKKLIEDFIVRYPGLPFLIHNGQEKNRKFIGILYQEQQFYLFSPYCLFLDSQTNALKPLNKEELALLLTEHFYSFTNTLTYESSSVTVPIAICSFAKGPKLQSESKLPLIIESESSKSITSQQQDFFSYIFSHYMPNSLLEAKQILQSVRDCHIKGLLAEVYKKEPEYFTLELLCSFLEDAIRLDHLLLAVEICTIDLANKELTCALNAFYINRYFLDATHYKSLNVMLLNFREAGIEASSFIDEHLKKAGSDFPKDTTLLIEDSSIFQTFLSLGFKLNEHQREDISRQLSTDIYGYAVKSQSRLTFSYEKKEIDALLQDKIKIINIMTSQGYSLHVGDGHPKKQYPFIALLKAKQSDLIIGLCKENKINLESIDNKSKTVLNHITKLQEWTLVNLLCELGAPYASGSHISYQEIPLLTALFNEAKPLEQLQPYGQKERLLTLTVEEGDALSVALKLNKLDIAEFLLANGFLEKLIKNPTLYLYRSGNAETAIFILKKLPVGEIRTQSSLEQRPPFHYKDGVVLQKIAMKNTAPVKDLVSLIGISRDQADGIISSFPFSSLTKIVKKGSNTVFYSANDELTDLISFHYYPQCIKQQLQSIEQLFLYPQKDKIPDVSFYINQINDLQGFVGCLQKIISKNRSSFVEYLNENPGFRKENYSNNFHCFEKSKKPIGFSVRYNSENKVSDFCFLDDIRILDSRGIFEGFDFSSCDFENQCNNLQTSFFMQLLKMGALKIIFEEIFAISFTKLLEAPFNPDKDFLQGYQKNYLQKILKFKEEEFSAEDNNEQTSENNSPRLGF